MTQLIASLTSQPLLWTQIRIITHLKDSSEAFDIFSEQIQKPSGIALLLLAQWKPFRRATEQ